MTNYHIKTYISHHLILFLFIAIFPLISRAEIKVPDYNFTLEMLSDYFPGKTREEVDKKTRFGFETIKDKGNIIIIRYPINYSGYRFNIYLQYFDGVVTDFFTRLPSYFLHDLFHQSLINRYGKQDLYLRKDNSAVYIWKDVKGLRHMYNGSCTITCFPVFYTAQQTKLPSGVESLLDQFQKGSNFQ